MPRQKFGLTKFGVAFKILLGWLGKNNNIAILQNMAHSGTILDF
jgi:hypothetical protein